MVTDAELAALGLYDPSSPDADERLGFVRYALELGATLEDLAASGPEITVMRFILRPGRERFTIAEAAERAGLAVEDALRISRASGFADPPEDDRSFTDEDVELFRTFGASRAFFGEEGSMQLVRVVSASMARIAEASVSRFAVNLGSKARDGAVDPLQIARDNQAALNLLPGLVRVMDVLLRRHIEARSRTELDLETLGAGVEALDRAVGFCDLVGYTSLTSAISTAELGTLLSAFETRAADLVAQHGGHVVKLIGDEVMFVAADAETGADIATRIAETFASDPKLPDIRIGLAAGRVVAHQGDYYGPVVNLAARLVKLARPGEVVVPASTETDLGRTYRLTGREPRTLKGFTDPVEVAVLERARP